MTPQEMIQKVKAVVGTGADAWRDLDALRKVFGGDDMLRGRALWEAFAAGALDLARGPAWWDQLGYSIDTQPFDRVRAAFAVLPQLHAKAASEHAAVRGLGRTFWSVEAFVEALVRTRPDELRAAIDTLPPEAQASCVAQLLHADAWGDGALPAAFVARAAEGFVSYAHDEALHTKARARLGDDAWWRAVAEALVAPGVKPMGFARLGEALRYCSVAGLFAALDNLAQSYDDHYRAGACVLLDAAFARDAAETTARLDALVPATVSALGDELSGTLDYDSDRAHRVRRLGPALGVAVARHAGQRGAEPDPRIDKLLAYEFNLSDSHDLPYTREAFAALPLARREAVLAPSLAYTRGLAVAPLAMTPKLVDALVEVVLRWNPKYPTPADKALEAFAQGGVYARDALRVALGKDNPNRPVFARALGRFPEAAVAADLVHFAQTATKPTRPAFVEALVGQGAHGVSAAATLLASKKADARELAVEVLKGLAAVPEHAAAVAALAAERAGGERSAALRAALEALASTPAEGAVAAPTEDDFEAQLAALAEAVPEAERAAVRQAMLDTGGQAAADYKHYGAAVLPYLLAWVRAAGHTGSRYESFYRFTEVLDRHYDHPLAPRIAIAALYAVDDKKAQAGKHFTRTLRLSSAQPLAWQELPWPERQKRHAALAESVRRQLIAALSAELPPQREYVLEWLAKEAPAEAAPAFVKALADSAKGVRDMAVEVLTTKATPDDALAAKVAGHLADKSKTTRLAAAMVLASWRLPSVADAVQKALAREKQPEVAAEMQRALPDTPAAVDAPSPAAAVAAAAPAVAAAGAVGEEDEATLDARLAGLKAPKAPKWLDVAALPALRWRGGAALSAGATRWFLGWLAQESDTRHDAELMAVRRRIVDEDCYGLCDAIRDQWRAGGSAKGAVEFVLAQQAVLGSEARLWELGSVQQGWYDSKQYKANALAMEVLARHGGYSGLAWLEHWAARARGGQFTKAVTAAAEAVCAQRGAPLEELVDAAVPTTGSAADVVNWHRERWELAMIVGRRFPVALWRAHFVAHPLLAEAARAVVFRAVETGAVFRVDASGAALDVAGAAVSLEGVASVEIVHPASLTAAEADAWRAVQTGTLKLSGVPLGPFGQFSRAVFRVAPGGGDPFDARVKQGAKVLARTLVQRLRAERFEPGDLIDGGSYGKGVRRIDRRWRVEIHHDGIAAQTSAMGPREKVDVTGVSLRRGDDWVEAKDAPVGLVSEAMGYLETMLKP